MAGNQKAISDLELGIREIFRIVVPGVYGIFLVISLAPNSSLAGFVTKSAGFGVGASFFVGLIGYALRPHERWGPYFLHFEHYRIELNDEISRIIMAPPQVESVDDALSPSKGRQGGVDHVSIYKLFLETKASDVKDRIHYFSSFYYMLIELSLFSFLTALCITARYLLTLGELQGHGSVVFWGKLAVGLAVTVQVATLSGLSAARKRRSQIAMAAAILLAAIGLALPLLATFRHNLTDLAQSGWSPNYIPLLLVFAAFVFERLGVKQWKQIVREQVALVNARASELREISRRWPY